MKTLCFINRMPILEDYIWDNLIFITSPTQQTYKDMIQMFNVLIIWNSSQKTNPVLYFLIGKNRPYIF